MFKKIFIAFIVGLFLGFVAMKLRLNDYKAKNKKLQNELTEISYHFSICKKLYKIGFNVNKNR